MSYTAPPSRFTFHVSRFTFHVSRFTFHVSCLIFLLLFTLISIPVTAQTPAPQAVVGKVTYGVDGKPGPADLPVTLQFFSAGEWTHVYTTTLTADGAFRFDDLAEEAGNDFVTRVIYQDVFYYSEPANLSGDAEVTADILIFEPTFDPAAVRVDQAHLFIVPLDDRLQVAEYYLLGNTGDRTYVGTPDAAGQKTTVVFTLPPDAMQITFDGAGLGERYVGDAARFADTRAIPPGSATIEVSFSYELPYRDGLTVQRALDVPIQSVALVISSDSIGVSGDGIEFAGQMETQMGTAASYTAGPLAAGVPLVFTFGPQTQPLQTPVAAATSSPVASAGPQPRNATQEIGLGLIALALGGLASYGLWQSKATPPMPEAARPLVAEIAGLDARFAAGDLAEDAYQREREALKRRLRVFLPGR